MSDIKGQDGTADMTTAYEIIERIELRCGEQEAANNEIKQLIEQLKAMPVKAWDYQPVSQAAYNMHISTSKVYGLINSGRLKCVGTGRLQVDMNQLKEIMGNSR